MMKIKVMLYLFIYIESISSIITNNTFDENLVPTYQRRLKPVAKTRMKSRHTKYLPQMRITFNIDMQTSVQQTVLDNSVKRVADDNTKPINNKPIYRPRKKYLSPAERGRRIYGQTNYNDREMKKVVKTSSQMPEQREVSLIVTDNTTTSVDTDHTWNNRPTDIDRAEMCLKDLIVALEKLDHRIRKLYKTARTRKLYFFDTLLLTTQRFVDKLLNEAHDQTVTLNENRFRLDFIAPPGEENVSKSKKLKSLMNTQIVNKLLNNANNLKKKVDHSLNEVKALLDDFVQQFKITEDTEDNLLIHSDGTYELTVR